MPRFPACGYLPEARKGVWNILIYTDKRASAKPRYGLDLVGCLNVSDHVCQFGFHQV